MSWVNVGDLLVNVENINYIVRINPTKIVLTMSGGAKLEVVESMAVTLWNALMSERMVFYDTETPTRDFSGT